MKPLAMMRTARGFSLVEVLVSVIVISIGLLGIAKMQALAFSSTGVASMRSLAALEASSLAASMHANRVFWSAGGTVPGLMTINKTDISGTGLSGSADCAAGTCLPDALAGYDVQQWANAVNAVLPNPISTITCTTDVGVPVNCIIQITWLDRTVNMNQQTKTVAQNLQTTYELYVQP